MADCVVCRSGRIEPVYHSEGEFSVTSNATLRPGTTDVGFCPDCGHLQTRPIENIDGYYDTDYNILANSEEEDQLYAIDRGKRIYRNDHQVTTLLGLLELPAGARVLDYGCAKGAVLREAVKRRPDLVPYLFDVSENYSRFWTNVAPEAHRATYETRPEWEGMFDLVVSFFVLEHVADPRAMLAKIRGLLRPGGRVYLIVPNIAANVSDLICVDHVNHFSFASIRALLAAESFEEVRISDRDHQAAFVIIGRKSEGTAAARPAPGEIGALRERAHEMAAFWAGAKQRVRDFEAGHEKGRLAIYGSGVNGCFIASSLKNRDRLEFFVDRNPFRQGRTMFEVPIIDPEDLPTDNRLILVGLNPAGARAAVEEIGAWKGRAHEYFFL